MTTTSSISPAPDGDPLVLYGQTFHSRLLLGTARYPSPDLLEAAVKRAKPAMLTASLRRQSASPGASDSGNGFWELLRRLAAENALEVASNGSACVPHVSIERLDDICQARVALEGLAITQKAEG